MSHNNVFDILCNVINVCRIFSQKTPNKMHSILSICGIDRDVPGEARTEAGGSHCANPGRQSGSTFAHPADLHGNHVSDALSSIQGAHEIKYKKVGNLGQLRTF